jgi:PAS domain S-box-containing protein
MSERRDVAVRFATVLIVLVSLTAASFGLSRIHDEKELIFSNYRGEASTAMQVEIEYLRLRHALAQLASGAGDPGGRDDPGLRFDRFRQSFADLLDRDGAGDPRGLPGIGESIAAVERGLPEVEEALLDVEPSGSGGVRAAQERLDGIYEPLLHAVTLFRDKHGEDAEHFYRTHTEMQLAFLVMLGSGALLFLLLLRELRRSRRTYREVLEAEREVKAGQASLRDAIDSVAGAFVLIDREGRIALTNDRYKDFYPTIMDFAAPGVRLEDLTRIAYRQGQFRTDLDEDSFVALRLQRLAEAEAPWEQPLTDGRVLLIDERRTANGGTVSIRTDITSQKRTEHMLRQRLVALEAAFDGIAILDRGATFTFVNDSHARIYGFAGPDELLGRNWHVLYEQEELERLLAAALPELEAGRRWQGEAIGLRRDGSRFPQELTLVTIEGGGFICVVRDISMRRHAEEERARLQAQFHQAQKMEEVGRLASGIAHDFNNILTAMMGYATFLAEDLPEGSPERNFASQLVMATDRARQLIHRMLVLSRPQDVGRRNLDVVRLVQETVELLRAALPKSVELKLDQPGRECFAQVNPTQIGQVLMNLCVNAADAIGPDGGRIVISLGAMEIEADMEDEVALESTSPGPFAPGLIAPGRHAARMRVGPLKAGPHLRLCVTDTGCGIPRDVMERMFEPFFTTKEAGKGTGLGLASVHGIVSAHQGALVVDSAVGAGTRFEVLIPIEPVATISPAAAPAAAGGSPPGGDIPRGRERVLIVDDERQVADMLAHALERLGYDVAACESGNEALEVLSECPDAFDLIISDQMMPGLTGQQLAQRASWLRPDLPFLLCTGCSDVLAASEHSANVATVLRKPVEHRILALTIRAVLDRPPPAA